MKRVAAVAMAFLGLIAFLGLVAAGCGSSTTTTVTTGATSGSTATGTSSTVTAGSTTTTSAHAARASQSVAPTVHLATFKSPSGNIGCIVIDGGARCDIRRRSWSPPPRPASCPTEVDFGQGLAVGRHGPGRLVCAGDTTLDPRAAVLRYGTDTVSGGFRCESRTSGVTCTSTASRHGFFISIQRYRAF